MSHLDCAPRARHSEVCPSTMHGYHESSFIAIMPTCYNAVPLLSAAPEAARTRRQRNWHLAANQLFYFALVLPIAIHERLFMINQGRL